MSDVLVRDVDAAALEALKGRAKEQGRSLQAELKSILEQAARLDLAPSRRLADRIRRSLGKRAHADSAALLAEDRRR
jgi:antitoxin FitA